MNTEQLDFQLRHLAARLGVDLREVELAYKLPGRWLARARLHFIHSDKRRGKSMTAAMGADASLTEAVERCIEDGLEWRRMKQATERRRQQRKIERVNKKKGRNV
jgi:hypothetical protein